MITYISYFIDFRYTASILSQENRLQSVTEFLETTRQEVSRQGHELNRTIFDLDVQNGGISSLNKTLHSLQSSNIESHKRISTVDRMLREAENNFEEVMNLSQDLLLQRLVWTTLNQNIPPAL